VSELHNTAYRAERTERELGLVRLSELHNTAYRAERTDRELGLTVLLNVCGVNIFMGKAIC
jgi:hypothetical protein